jgi:hypothetical protein
MSTPLFYQNTNAIRQAELLPTQTTRRLRVQRAKLTGCGEQKFSYSVVKDKKPSQNSLFKKIIKPFCTRDPFYRQLGSVVRHSPVRQPNIKLAYCLN